MSSSVFRIDVGWASGLVAIEVHLGGFLGSDDVLGATLAKAERTPELAPMVGALHQLPTGAAPARG